MSREHDPLLGPTLKRAAIGSDLHWTDIALLTVMAKGNEALREAELNIPRQLENCVSALALFANSKTYEAERRALDQAIRDAKQMVRHTSRIQRRLMEMKRKVITNRHPVR